MGRKLWATEKVTSPDHPLTQGEESEATLPLSAIKKMNRQKRKEYPFFIPPS
jgi:hypothetical protein